MLTCCGSNEKDKRKGRQTDRQKEKERGRGEREREICPVQLEETLRHSLSVVNTQSLDINNGIKVL